MGLLTKLALLTLTIGSSFLFYKLLIEPHPVPKVLDEFWGPKSEQGKKEDISIRPFKIDISPAAVDDLKARLKRELDSNRLLAPLEDVGFEYGFNSKFLNKVGQHWLNKYDWRAREKLLNKYPHFKTKIGGLDIHFQHVKPKGNKQTRPLLVLHGWPGSIVEFQKIIPLLSEPKNSQHNYELVIPSLPGYGFSQAASRRGMSPTEMGNIFKRLMKRLGHDKFYVMGGDWGGIITSAIATVYPENVIAAQSNLCMSMMTVRGTLSYFAATLLPDLLMSEEEKPVVLSYPKMLSYMARETGYAHIQATKPDTIGVGLTHSPLGLAAYILEKFSTWTDRSWITREDGGLTEKFTLDELLDNVMVYWVTGSMISSQRLYAEEMNPTKAHQLDRVPTNVPFSCQFMKEEIVVLPEIALKDKYTNIQKYTISQRGGHFGAFEEPELVADNAISHFENN